MATSKTALDTIAAPATPVGRGALAIVRIDGPASARILQELSGVSPDVRMATLMELSTYGDILDQCIAVRYAAPHSFTGNDLVELTLHGGPVTVARTLRAILGRGARPAEPGEFTERAVLNGKLDLLQAEAIADLVDARTELQAAVSIANLEGALSRKAAAIRESLLLVIARLEAALDFSEEGYQFIRQEEARGTMARALDDSRALLDSYRRGAATRAGLEAVILGRPNAGKSTLLNRLIGSERAIVTPIPGTTRDIVRETIEIGGLPVTISDTAGLRETTDVVEGIGVERARNAATAADLVLYLIDATQGITEEDRAEIVRWPEAWMLYAKSDLAAAPAGTMAISAITDAGVAELLATLDAFVRHRFVAPEASLVNERQRQAVAECASGLADAVASLDAGHDEQIVLVDLYRAANALGVLIGAITREDIFEEIFSKFCIGK
ncbi:MAG TPA: tRNA uridine-5-carboxymethylaminomethyl(34) synthesis GTPase MnmE [Thermoanaerobaculia bacterium]|jgi:tRNA modification GTPase|nr:tRNA uridine-5-carboxymethylaminomethyl(34) synthesis GTPase MnmE [Thermoanaerobaculia bacterium]